jgi:hypothetical protein
MLMQLCQKIFLVYEPVMSDTTVCWIDEIYCVLHSIAIDCSVNVVNMIFFRQKSHHVMYLN